MQAAISAIEYCLPDQPLTTSDLAAEFPDWAVEKIEGKTGIHARYVVAEDECSSDLGVSAAQRLFDSGACRPEAIDFILLCTQSPDYFLPSTACVIQDRLGIPTTAGALDFNLGCSGYIYGLGLAQGLISTRQASNIMLITAETSSKFIPPQDKSVRAIFGDAAAATLVKAVDAESPLIGPFIYGTDGSGAPNLIVPASGMRNPRSAQTGTSAEDRSEDNLFMTGAAEIFTFTLSAVPQRIGRLLKKAGLALEDIDLFVFHQANRYMLDRLRKRMNISEESFIGVLGHSDNTASSTIPIALKHAACEGRITNQSLVMLVGCGMGYSWGATLLRWSGIE
jgi:3-oxoacyl-[acyl-carrier-protein] synthase-3